MRLTRLAAVPMAAVLIVGTLVVPASSGQELNGRKQSDSVSVEARAAKKRHNMWFGFTPRERDKTLVWASVRGKSVAGVGADRLSKYSSQTFCFKGTRKGNQLKGYFRLVDEPGMPRHHFKWRASGSGKKLKIKRINSKVLQSVKLRKLKKKPSWSPRYLGKWYYKSTCE